MRYQDAGQRPNSSCIPPTTFPRPPPFRFSKVVNYHCGRNTLFRQICFAVPNFNFIYIYKILKITRRPTYFLIKYAKTGNQRKLHKWREQMTLFVVILQVKTLIAIVYRPQEKNMQIILNVIWIFIIIHHFCIATFQSQHTCR